MIRTQLTERAYAFALAAHAAVGQRRKYSGDPYIVHPCRVAELVSQYTNDEHTVAAALLHDVVEDTQVTVRDIAEVFGERVAVLVYFLTDRSKPEDGNRATRKAIDRRHIAKASPAAQTVKLADLIDNTADIVKHDRGFARVYLAEKALLLEVLRKGHPALWLRAKDQLDAAADLLEINL